MDCSYREDSNILNRKAYPTRFSIQNITVSIEKQPHGLWESRGVSFVGSSREEPERVFLLPIQSRCSTPDRRSPTPRRLGRPPLRLSRRGPTSFPLPHDGVRWRELYTLSLSSLFLSFKFLLVFTSRPSSYRSPRTRRAAEPSGLRTCGHRCGRERLPTYRHPPVCRPLPHLRCR